MSQSSERESCYFLELGVPELLLEKTENIIVVVQEVRLVYNLVENSAARNK
jgi:hypothetical protein